MSVFCECCVLSGRGLCKSLSLIQRISTECGVSEGDREVSIKSSDPLRTVASMGKKVILGEDHKVLVFLLHNYFHSLQSLCVLFIY
jgi:hypothetical protein